MSQPHNINYQQESDFKKIAELILRNYKLFISCLIVVLGLAFLINRYSIPVYEISSSLLIKEDSKQGGGMNDFLNSSLLGKNQNFQNELWVLQSAPVVQKTVQNLDLSVSYYLKDGFQYKEIYNDAPFRVLLSPNHAQPLNVRFHLTFLNGNNIQLKAEADEVSFYNYSSGLYVNQKTDWSFQREARIGKLIETPDISLIIEVDSTRKIPDKYKSSYNFILKDINALANGYKKSFKFEVVDKKATVIKISLRSESPDKGVDLVNGLMDVYSQQNLERKNHNASITIDYIEKQLGEISDSLNLTEDNLQRFRSSNQLLDVNQQASGISTQYIDLQNQRAELVTRKRYYDYVADYLEKNDDFSNMIVPASMGIQDQILNNLMSELITAQAQRSNLIENKQERNPLVKKLDIQIANTKKTISDNISAVRQTINISIDEMNKRIQRTEARISNLPKTQRQLGGFERKYRLNDAIYNYLLEKRAEAKITKASNLPDDIIIEPAAVVGQVSPDHKKNYLIAFVLGLGLPLGFLTLKKALNNKIESQDDVEKLTDVPIVGKILHNNKKTTNVLFEYPKSNTSESFRALRTNLDYYLKGGNKKIIMITSCLEGEGKSFNALNIAMSYAQLGRKTILLDLDLRKPSTFFNGKETEATDGISSYLINKVTLEELILKSPHEKLDFMRSGPIPPNPAELLASEETGKMIQKLKDYYDYIILDTPPLAQVTDGFLLIDYADLRVLVVRNNYAKKKVLSVIIKDLKMKEISNVCIVLNDNKIKGDQYGYGYGYYKKK